VPKIFGVREAEGNKFLEMENLLQDVAEPSVMDLKLGTRTFVNCQRNSKKRRDLYDKMVSLCPTEPSSFEKDDQMISKTRYLTFRDSYSTTSRFGFRIEGVQIRSEGKISSTPRCKLQAVNSLDGAISYLKLFVGTKECSAETYKDIYYQLGMIEQAAKKSAIFKSHNMIGTSILFILGSDGKCKVKLIDFARSAKLEEGEEKSDGWLAGIESLKAIICSAGFSSKPESFLLADETQQLR
jgi:1D-myo-inositol-triphosphate 3-kinase